jgi:hypothetical protein
MRKCNVCEGTWLSQSKICIHCGSDDIIWDYVEEKQKEREEEC